MVKRRVQQEPAIAKYVTFPVPTLHEPINIEWDFDHLLLYIKVVEEFANWYQKYKVDQFENDKAMNLTMILARLEACFKAANVPSQIEGYATPFSSLTSKERACIELVTDEVAKGRRPIVFARSPAVLHRFAAEFDKAGITNFVFSGEENIKKRLVKLDNNIRNGDTQVMLATLGVTSDGLNLYQLNTFIFYNRSWCVFRRIMNTHSDRR